MVGTIARRILVDAGFLGVSQFPDLFALEVGLDDLAVVDVAQVKELLSAFLAHVDAVAAGVIALAERADEFALGVEDDDGVHRRAAVALVLDVDQTLVVDGDAVRRLPVRCFGSSPQLWMHS